MKGLLKNSGLILIIIGVVLLIVNATSGTISDNVVLGIAAALIFIGLIAYIIINKFIAD